MCLLFVPEMSASITFYLVQIDSHPLECIIPDDVLIQFDPPDDENLLLETCRGVK
jgi:hypothetical protein